MEKNKFDYIIVGQGLAGSILSYTLSKLNKKVLVIDKGFENSSSKVAAGIINSLVLKRLTKSWRADESNAFNTSFYTSLEADLQEKIYYPTKAYKLISAKEEEKYWLYRLNEESLEKYMCPKLEYWDNSYFNLKKVGKIKQVASIDVLKFLTSLRFFFENRNSLKEETFDYKNIGFLKSGVAYKDICAKKIIFCEGHQGINNPFFKWLPFSLNKGELLTIEAPELDLSAIVNKKIFILPIGNQKYKIGATNEWKELNNVPTEKKKIELLDAFNTICTVNYKVFNQEAGIRPATKDRRPFIGIHPEKPELAIFNGMGAKTALMAPLLAKEFAEHLEGNINLNSEYNISRYLKLY